MEATTSSEALRQKGRLGGSATMRAATRVNAEQASKRVTRKPTLPDLGEGCHRSGSERRGHRPVPPGYWRRHAWKRGLRQHGKPRRWRGTRQTDNPRGMGRAVRGGGEARNTGEAG